MYLEKLQLQNFRCFKDVEINFHKKMTIIVGANGAGKSSIMEGAAIAVSSLFIKMDGLPAKKIDKGQARLEAYDVGSIKDVQAQYPVVVTASAFVNEEDDDSRSSEKKVLRWTRSLSSSTGQTLYGDAKEITSLGLEYQDRIRKGDSSLVLPMIAYYGTGRLWDYHREKQSDVFEVNNRLNGYIDCVDGTANLKLMMNWFSKMTVQKYQNLELGLGKIPELEAVYAAMESCYRKITGYSDVKVQYSMGTRELEIAYRNEDNELMRIPINQLSDGYKSTISLVADIAYRMAVLNPQLLDKVCTETDGIVLIDEIDLHLHPTWQQRILEDLTDIFPELQFVVSTHAPSVISSAKSENLLILDQYEVYEPSGEVYGRDTSTIVRSVMNALERPKSVKKLFADFYHAIDESDVEKAEYVLNHLKAIMGNDEPEISSCNIKLKLLKMRTKK